MAWKECTIVSDQSPGWKFSIWNPLQPWKFVQIVRNWRRRNTVIKSERVCDRIRKRIRVSDNFFWKSLWEKFKEYIAESLTDWERPCITPELHCFLVDDDDYDDDNDDNDNDNDDDDDAAAAAADDDTQLSIIIILIIYYLSIKESYSMKKKA